MKTIFTFSWVHSAHLYPKIFPLYKIWWKPQREGGEPFLLSLAGFFSLYLPGLCFSISYIIPLSGGLRIFMDQASLHRGPPGGRHDCGSQGWFSCITISMFSRQRTKISGGPQGSAGVHPWQSVKEQWQTQEAVRGALNQSHEALVCSSLQKEALEPLPWENPLLRPAVIKCSGRATCLNNGRSRDETQGLLVAFKQGDGKVDFNE